MAKKKILLVDDEEDIIKMNRLRLIESNYDVVSATNGGDALKKAESEKPDLVVLDIMMHEMDGIQVLSRLKSNPKTSSIPVIMLSGLGEDAMWHKAKFAGAIDYITKPFNAEMLLDAINKHIKN